TSSSAALDGVTFPFDVIDAAGEQTVKVTAVFHNGQCTIVPISLPVGSVVTATEPATQFVGANGMPANTAVTQTLTIAPGINSITFTNQAFGQLEICKHLVG